MVRALETGALPFEPVSLIKGLTSSELGVIESFIVVVASYPPTKSSGKGVMSNLEHPEDENNPSLRRLKVVLAGFNGDPSIVLHAKSDPDPSVRVACLGALERLGIIKADDIRAALDDPDSKVRRRGCEIAAKVKGKGSRSTITETLISALQDSDPLVVEGACWALGERQDKKAVSALCELSSDHRDPRCREAALAALGAIGDSAGLTAILDRLEDKPQIRRRAVVALAAFEGDKVDAALTRSLDDRDWQVRQAAQALLAD